MFVGMDARGPGLAPRRNDFSAASLFFVAWTFIGGFLSLNLFVGAIVDNFTKIKAQTDGSVFMTAEQAYALVTPLGESRASSSS